MVWFRRPAVCDGGYSYRGAGRFGAQIFVASCALTNVVKFGILFGT